MENRSRDKQGAQPGKPNSFVQAKTSEFRSSSYDCLSSSTLWLSLLLFAMFLGFLETVNSPSYYEARSLVDQAISWFRSFWISSVADNRER